MSLWVSGVFKYVSSLSRSSRSNSGETGMYWPSNAILVLLVTGHVSCYKKEAEKNFFSSAITECSSPVSVNAQSASNGCRVQQVVQ